MEFWKDAWRSIFRRPSRSGLTVLSIAIGVFAVMLIGTIGQMGEQAISSELSSLGMHGMAVRAADQSGTVLTRTELELIKEMPSVSAATPLVVEYSDIKGTTGEEKAVIWGVDADVGNIISMKLIKGRGIQHADISSAAPVCVIEEGVAIQLFGRSNVVGRTLQVSLGGQECDLEIVGIAAAGGNLFQSMMGNTVPLFIYLPYTVHQQYTGRTGFDRIAVQFQSDEENSSSEVLTSALDGWFGQNGSVAVDNLSQYADTFERLMEMVTGILAAIAGISLIVAGLSVMTAMLSSVGERTREIGIKKSMGAPSGTIITEFLLEAVFLSAAGSGAGILAGIVVGWLGSWIVGMPYQIPAELILVCLASALLTGAIFGAYPARKASLLRPVEALR
ncbi:MAG: ABC transporter permease [Candidatus Merdivicinus sp.]|jgi:putative ABC transport system permease protein